MGRAKVLQVGKAARRSVAPNTLATLRGKPFPDWKVSDARGVGKTVQPSDYKGKWLLVQFWGFW